MSTTDHKDKFFKYFRMTQNQFNILYLKINNYIRKLLVV